MKKFRKSHFLIQLPLFDFSRKKKTKMTVAWSKEKVKYKVTCNAKEGTPGSKELVVFNCLLYLRQHQSTFTNSDLLELLGKSQNTKNFSSWVKQSLQILSNAKYTFTNCVESGKTITTTIVKIKTKGKGRGLHYEFSFPKIIEQHLEQKGKYQLIDLEAFLQLPTGLSQRLYEFLEKKKNQCRKGFFNIAEQQICQWIAIHGKYLSDRVRTLQKATNILIEQNYLADNTTIGEQCSFVFTKQGKAVQKIQCVEKTHQSEAAESFIRWIMPKFPNFEKEILERFPRQELDDYFPILKQIIEQTKHRDIASINAWVTQAIREKWQPKPDLKKRRKEKTDIKSQIDFEKNQSERYEREEKQRQKLMQQNEVKKRISEIKKAIDNPQKLWEQAVRSSGEGIIGQNGLVKLKFGSDVAQIAGFNKDILDFPFCDYLVSILIPKTKNKEQEKLAITT